jgi:hypothetical protein
MNLTEIDSETRKDLFYLKYPFSTHGNTQAEVCKWLREKRGYHIMISFNDGMWKADIIDIRIYKDEIIADTKLQESFEQAELTGIKEAIEILKEK